MRHERLIEAHQQAAIEYALAQGGDPADDPYDFGQVAAAQARRHYRRGEELIPLEELWERFLNGG